MTKKPNKKSVKIEYDYHDTFEELYGVAVIGKDGKFGYANRHGVAITPLKYDRAMRFHWDVGKVQLNGKWGLVNKQGKEITPLMYDEIKGHQDPIVRLGNKYGFVSRKTGKLITPIKYDDAKEWTQILNFSSRKLGHKDLALVQLDGKWGCINLQGEEVIPAKYEEIDINQFNNPRIVAKLNGEWGFINEDGKEVTSFEYDDVEPFSNNRARVRKNGKYGFINTKGLIAIQLIYDDCEPRYMNTYHDEDKHILPLWVKQGDRYGFINHEGTQIVKLKYDYVQQFNFFSEGLVFAPVVLNGAVGFIDEKGKNVIPCQYEPDFNSKYSYCFYGNFANVKQNGKWGVIDAQNQLILPFLYDEFFENQGVGFRYALRDGIKLSVDSKGNEWELKKNSEAHTFKDYLHSVSWTDVAESFKSLICIDEETIDSDLKIYESSFNNFLSKESKPSNDIIRIFSDDGQCDWERPTVDARLVSVKDECSYAIFDWAEILDMEIRIEDNLTLSDSDIVAICIWEAGDQMPVTEEGIKSFLNKLDEQTKTIDENRAGK